jgi:transcriptional regulator with XRE-family HTH domain
LKDNNGSRIAHYRKKLGLKQKELATLVGTKPKYLNVIEKGRVDPGVVMIARIAALGVSMYELTKKE